MPLKRNLEVDPLRFMRQSVRTELDVAEALKAIEQWANRQPAVGQWIEPTFVGLWANFNVASFPGARYRLVGDTVEVEGVVRTTGNIAYPNSTIFTLPEGFRPPLQVLFLQPGSIAADTFCRLQVLVTGEVQLVTVNGAGSAASTIAYLGLSFRFSTLVTPKK